VTCRGVRAPAPPNATRALLRLSFSNMPKTPQCTRLLDHPVSSNALSVVNAQYSYNAGVSPGSPRTGPRPWGDSPAVVRASPPALAPTAIRCLVVIS
jgi:hypothetical protein